MSRDVHFDGIAGAFEAEIYGSSKGRIRLAVLWEDLLEAVPELAGGGLRVLDVGGGAGHMAVRLGRLGNKVVLCEPSQDMLDRAAAAVTEAGLAGQVQTRRVDIQGLAGMFPPAWFDVITCHAVLEWLEDPAQAVATMAACLARQGVLSLMFYNRNASLLKRMLPADFTRALEEAHAGPERRGWGTGAMPLDESAVRTWLAQSGLAVRTKAGIRIFHDHIRDNQLTAENLDALLTVERALRHTEPFASLGQHIHLTAQSS